MLDHQAGNRYLNRQPLNGYYDRLAFILRLSPDFDSVLACSFSLMIRLLSANILSASSGGNPNSAKMFIPALVTCETLEPSQRRSLVFSFLSMFRMIVLVRRMCF